VSELRHFVYQPEGPLRRYVREILWVRSARARVQILLPETTLTLVLRQSGMAFAPEPESSRRNRLPACRSERAWSEHAADLQMVIVRFTEVGAPPITARPGGTCSITRPWRLTISCHAGDRARSEYLANTGDVRQHVPCQVERFLTSQIRAHNPISRRSSSAAQMIRISEADLRLQRLHVVPHEPKRTWKDIFRAAVGTTPKRLSRLARLQYVCRLWTSGKTLPRSPLKPVTPINRHMVHDFRLFTVRSPEAFFEALRLAILPTFYK